nr:signal peptide peptidase-like 2B [Rhipicephalus microplus]
MAAQDSCLPLHGINLTGAVVLINDTSRCPLETAARNYGNTSAYALVVGLSDNRLLVALLVPALGAPLMPVLVALLVPGLLPGAVAGAGAAAAGGDVSKREIAGTKRMTESSVGDIDAELTPVGILVFVVFMSSSLVIIYLLIQYLVYVIIGMFVLASSVALIGVLDPLVHRLPVGTTKIPMIPCFYIQLEVRQVCVIVLSILVSFSFVVVRHHPLSWLMQDALGITFCIYMIRTLRMPNLQKGDSIMVEVARGGGTDELIPMVFRVPRLGDHDLAACFGEWTLLGLGDILIPGFLVAYVHGFDLIASQRRFYYTVTVIGYGVGLVVTFLALFLMKTAQPALLYLVPATLIPVVAIARCRGELNDIWYGFKPVTPPPSEEAEPPAVAQGKEQRTDSRRKSLDKSEETTSTEPSGSAVGDPPATRSPAQPQRVVRPTIPSPAGAASSVQPPALLSTMFTLGMR